MKRHEVFLTVLILCAASGSGGTAPRQWGLPLPEPHQLVGVEGRLDELYGDGVTSQRIVVDLGGAVGPPSAFETLREWTVLGAGGWAHAQLVDIEKRCEYLCGTEEGSESCYYVAIIEQAGVTQDIGVMLAALPGSFDLLDYAALSPRPVASLKAVLTPSDRYTGLFENEDYRVIAYDGDTLKLAFRRRADGNEHVYEAEAAQCSAEIYGTFKLTSVNCDALSVLSDGEPLIVSYADYNIPKTIPLAEFTFGNSKYYVVRYGAKAQDIIGLVAAAPWGWRGLFKGRDRALIC